MSDTHPLYLVDGSGYIFRAYYAIRPLSTKQGLPTNALLGFTKMLLKLLRDVSAKYIVVTFDTGEPTFRHLQYSEYKANREECPADLIPQMPYFRKIVKALGICCLEKPGFEADDIIATLTKRALKSDNSVFIVSGDKDLTQLVNENVVVWDAMRDIKYDRQGVVEKFGVTPEQIIDYLALVGDSSDNVPGLKGVGSKTAQKLLEFAGSIEKLVQQPEMVEKIPGIRGAAGIKEKLESSVEAIRLSQALVKLDEDVEPFNQNQGIDEFHWTGAEQALLVPLFEELEFSKLVESINTQMGLAFPKPQEKTNDLYQIITKDSLSEFVQKLSNVKEFAFDTETSSLDPLTTELVGISISWKNGEAYYLPLGGAMETERLLDSSVVRDLLNPIFSNPDIKKVGVNLKYDARVLQAKGYSVEGLSFDAMLASYVLGPDRRQHGLKAMARNHLGVNMQTFEEVLGDADNIGQVAIDRVAHYACADADYSWQLQEPLSKLLGETELIGPSLRKVFEQVEMPLVAVLAQIEQNGVKIDCEFLQKLGVEYDAELAQLNTRICELAGVEFNLNSPKQVSEILFEKLAIPAKGIKKTQTSYSTDSSVLSKLAPDYEIAARLLEYRELFKLKTTYIDSLLRLADPNSHRIHTSFNQAIAATGRLSSSDPNLQNIPIRGERGRQIRKGFIADEGSLLVSADYSQIELRLLAHLSGDKNLIAAFQSGEDIHSATARELLGSQNASEQELKDLRRVAKTINFGVIYGIGASRLGRSLGISRIAAQEYIDRYFAKYPTVSDYFQQLEQQANDLGYTETLCGRRRYLSEIDTSGRDGGYAFRSLINFPLQGTAAEIIKLAMIQLHGFFRYLGGANKMVLQVHDELVFEVDSQQIDSVKEQIKSGMEGILELSVPLVVDVSVGRTWGDKE